MTDAIFRQPLGTVTADATSFPNGYLIIGDDGDVCLECHTPGYRLDLSLSLNDDTAAISATTQDGWTLSAPVSFATNSSANTAGTVVRFTPMEATLSRPGSDPTAWDVKEFWINGPSKLARAKWTAGGYDFEVARARDQNGQKVMDVTLLRVRRGPNPEDFEKVKRGTLALLSLASRTHCAWFCERTFSGDDLLQVRAIPAAPYREATHSLIPNSDLENFMASCTGHYLASAEDYGLEVLVSYYCRSHQERLAEAKMIFAGVVMEAFKFYWAKNLSGLSQDVKANGLIRGFLNPSGRLYDFASLLQMASSSLGLSHVYTFLDDRNALFHTGQPASVQTLPGQPTWPTLKAELVRLHDQIDDVLLTILQYNGTIRTYWQQDVTITFPQRTPV